MQKKIAYVFLAVSLAFFLFVTGLSGYRIETARRANGAYAGQQARQLLETAASVRESSGGFDSPFFRQKMREAFDAEPRLLLLSVHSEADGILYLVTRNRSYLKEPREADPAWRGVPSYHASRGYEAVISLPFDGTLTGASLDALFIVLGREDLYGVVRDDLFMFLGFMLLSGILIVILMGIGEEAGKGGVQPSAAPVTTGRPPSPPGGSDTATDRARAGRGLTSPRSGLAWADHFEPCLRNEIDRAASADLDLSLACIRIDGPPRGDDLPRVYADIARAVKEVFPLADLAFEAGEISYAIIIPETDIDQAVRALERLRAKVAAARKGSSGATVSIGTSSRGGRLMEWATLAEEAATAVRKASREGGNRVIGFRANAAKYRETLSAAGA